MALENIANWRVGKKLCISNILFRAQHCDRNSPNGEAPSEIQKQQQQKKKKPLVKCY